MSNSSNSANFLSSLTDDSNVLAQVREAALSTFGVDITKSYCLHTGRPIGTIDSEELLFALREEPTEDIESLADAMVIRCVATMRPSPALNKPDDLTIANLASARPRDCLAFLLNRLYGNRLSLRHRDESSFDQLLTRVKNWRFLQDSQNESLNKSLSAVLHWLLELDSKLNLHDLSAPYFERNRLNQWVVSRSAAAQPLINCLTESDFLPAFESWVFTQLKSVEDLKDLARRQELWTQKGNRFSGPAYVRSWLENPEFAQRKTGQSKKDTSRLNRDAAKLKKPSNAAKLMSLLDSAIAAKPKNPTSTAASLPRPKPKAVALTGGMLFKPKSPVNPT